MDSSTVHDIDMDSFPGDDDSRAYVPPPHIAARFYRKTNARRRSSAHSSRRSSLSSLHSALSAHGGPQSNHVAQHLRRASIIESRKARLADRAAHAEQVRMRAAIAKATPRAAYREERALAAQAAREKLLAEITARCEEEVRRAKKVAEETKEKKAAEHARLKEEMAEKLAEAARRRSIYQRNNRRPRTTSLPFVEEKKIDPIALRQLTEDAAARIIQRSWRLRRNRHALSEFVGLDLTLATVKNMPFERVGQLLAEDRVMHIAASALNALGLIDAPVSDTNANRGTTRIFLGLFLILGHPLQALSHGGKEPQEQDLIVKAEALLDCFEGVLQKFQNRKALQSNNSAFSAAEFVRLPSQSEVDSLSSLFNNYTSAFYAWKSHDSSALVDIMVNQFVELDLILQTVKDDRDGGVADDYFQAIRHNQIQLLARLKKFAGPEKALSRVRSAVRKARKQRANSRAVTDQSIPRASGTESSSEIQGATVLDSANSEPVQRSQPSLTTVQGPSSFVSRLGQTMTILPHNREIAHEIQINGTYEVQQQPWTNSRKHFVDGLRSSMRQSMSQGGTEAAASWTHAMAILVRDKLLNLISRRHPLYDRIDGFLDPKLIYQQCRAGMFSYESFFETIAGLIGQICSPGRDEAVKSFADDTTSDTINRLFTLINIIDLMTLDHINFQFRRASSQVVEHGHEHERSNFEKLVSDGTYTLASTRRWWANARSNVAPTTHPTSQGNTIYARGLVDLVLSNSHLSYASLPETLHLDWVRLVSLRARAFKIAATASILLTTKIRLRRNREAQWTKDAERLMALDWTDVEASRIVSIIESSHMMPEATKEGLLNFVGRALPPASAAARYAANAEKIRLEAMQDSGHQLHLEPNTTSTQRDAETEAPADIFTEQVATFVLKSLREHVFSRLSAASTAEKVRHTTSAAELLARAGMPEFVNEVGAMVDVLEKVKTVDLRSHEVWYDEVARDVAREVDSGDVGTVSEVRG